MVLKSEEWYEGDILKLLDGVMTGEYALALKMSEEGGRYEFMEPDLYPMSEIKEMLSWVTKDWEVIYNIVFNYNLVKAYRVPGLIGLRYLGMEYIDKVMGRVGHGGNVFLIEPIEEEEGDGHSLIGDAERGRILWQDNELLKLMFDNYWERSVGDTEFLSVGVSGVDDLGSIFHLFLRVPKSLHPEMVSPVTIVLGEGVIR